MSKDQDHQKKGEWPERLQAPEFDSLHREAEALAKALMGRPPKSNPMIVAERAAARYRAKRDNKGEGQ